MAIQIERIQNLAAAAKSIYDLLRQVTRMCEQMPADPTAITIRAFIMENLNQDALYTIAQEESNTKPTRIKTILRNRRRAQSARFLKKLSVDSEYAEIVRKFEQGN